MNLITEPWLQHRFVIASVVYPQSRERERGAMEFRRGHHGLIRESVKGPDIEPDRVVSTRMYVTLEAHEKKMKANDDALRWRSRRTYIAEALLGIMILVAIVMAGINLQKMSDLEEKLQKDLNQKEDLFKILEDEFKKTVSKEDLIKILKDEFNKTLSMDTFQ